MAEIEVRTSDLGDRYECRVTIRERRGTSQHQVKVRIGFRVEEIHD